MNILICTGSFKDTYTSIEFCEQIKKLFRNENCVVTAPFCDGGEYTLDVLKYYFNPQIEYIHNIYNSYLMPIDVPYMILDNQVYLFTSEIIRLSGDEEKYKNPLNLSDYGVGQALKYLYQSGYHKIHLCIGGTSTVCCGAGAAQALGMRFFDMDGNVIDDIICGRDLYKITNYAMDEAGTYSDLELFVLADGDINSREMPSVSELKISKIFEESRRKEILKEINQGVYQFSKIVEEEKRGRFTGAAGGLIMGLELVGSVECCLGSEYFSKLFCIEDKIKTADIIITGEGRLDNSACGKSPFMVLHMAQKYQKQTIYIVGSASNEYLQGEKNGIVRNDILKKSGIDILLNCQYLYTDVGNDTLYNERVKLYRTEMIGILKNLIKEINL